MDLGAFITKYQELSGGFDQPVHLSRFGLSNSEMEKLIAAWDEDYQISRYMALSREKDEALVSFPEGQRIYLINGFDYSHVSFHPDIKSLL